MRYQQALKSVQQSHATKSFFSAPPRLLLRHFAANPISEFWRTSDNQTVSGKLDAENTQIDPTTSVKPGFGHNFGRVSIYSPYTTVPQMKLEVSQPGDIYEQEADQVAEQIIASDPNSSVSGDKAQTKTSFMPKADNGPQGNIVSDTTSLPPVIHEVLNRDQGQPLDSATRAFMEPRFGHDFSRVRVHTKDLAARSAHALQARAYTVGQHIVFGSGAYTPGTIEGKQLLAHELTHAIQQTNHPARSIQRKLEVNPGLTLDTLGFTNVTKTGNSYSSPAITKGSIWNEIFTSLLYSPRTFKVIGTTNAEINKNLKDHMISREGVVDFASKKKYTFAVGAATKMNPAYWLTSSKGYALIPGKDSDKAINDLNVNPREYAIGCATATKLTLLGGGKSELANSYTLREADWIPGEAGYIENTKFSVSKTPGQEGENIIYTGNNKFWGHLGPGLDYRTFDDWFDEVISWDGGATTHYERTSPKRGLELP